MQQKHKSYSLWQQFHQLCFSRNESITKTNPSSKNQKFPFAESSCYCGGLFIVTWCRLWTHSKQGCGCIASMEGHLWARQHNVLLRKISNMTSGVNSDPVCKKKKAWAAKLTDCESRNESLSCVTYGRISGNWFSRHTHTHDFQLFLASVREEKPSMLSVICPTNKNTIRQLSLLIWNID